MYDRETQDLQYPIELRELKWHYIGWKRSQTLNIPLDIFGWASAKHNELFYREFTKGCGPCIPNDICSLLIATGIGTD